MNPNENRHLLQQGDRLPPLHLPTAPDGKSLEVRAPAQRSSVILFLPSDQEKYHAYRTALVEAVDAFQQWDGRLLLVVSGELEVATRMFRESAASLLVFADPTGEARTKYGLDEDSAAVFIADRWGQIYDVVQTYEEHKLPTTKEIEEWLKFLATQCPECGVIDEPGYGEWTLH